MEWLEAMLSMLDHALNTKKKNVTSQGVFLLASLYYLAV